MSPIAVAVNPDESVQDVGEFGFELVDERVEVDFFLGGVGVGRAHCPIEHVHEAHVVHDQAVELFLAGVRVLPVTVDRLVQRVQLHGLVQIQDPSMDASNPVLSLAMTMKNFSGSPEDRKRLSRSSFWASESLNRWRSGLS